MMTEVATTKDFQQRMFERIRDQIGDLLTEDDLRKIVSAAMDKALWEKQEHHDRYGSVTNTTDGILMTEFRALVRDRLSAGIRDYLRENDEKIMEVMRQEAAKVWPAMVAGMFKSIAEQTGYAFVQELRNQGVLR
jgi:transcriptional regulator CtsR